ncbi:MAG: hypothetical protein M1838_004629 [Thelocarpon superellum]|nr:MAG: hypothetical protein M1838_004629 [Thelocarpon superellum]
MAFQATSHPGLMHHYAKKLVAFEHLPSSSTTPPANTIIFTGGLSDGLFTLPYTRLIAAALPSTWSYTETLITSSYTGWGTGSLGRDADEIAQLVTYVRAQRPGGKIVLMGHSTGCQDTVRYISGPIVAGPRPAVDGVILQAGASDREALLHVFPAERVAHSVTVAEEMIAQGKGEEILPSDVTGNFFDTPCCARRWLSLASPRHDGEDDYFSSDLTDAQLQQTFGRFPPGSPLCLLYSGADQYVPSFVDKELLLKRWKDTVTKNGGVVDEQSSVVVKGASHNLNGDDDAVVNSLVERVVGFVKRVESGELVKSA